LQTVIRRDVHSTRLRPPDCAKRSSEDLGRTPDLVFLHNPERTLAGLPTSEGRCQLAAACNALAETVAASLCRAWGIAARS
jgi:pyridoxine 4-dehydrogenase